MKLIVDFILVVGIVLSILPIVGILKLKDRKAPQYILIVFWALILNIFVYFYAMLHELPTLQWVTNLFQDGVRFLIPPLFYVYVKSIFMDRKHLLRKNSKHFLVFLIHFFVYVIPKSIDPYSDYIFGIYYYIRNWAVVQDIFGIVYFSMALVLFYKFRRLLKSNYSNIGEEGFLWIEKFLFSFLMVLVVDLIVTFTEVAFGYNVAWDAYITIFFLVVAMAYLGYYGLTQSTVFLPRFLIENNDDRTAPAAKPANYLKAAEKEELRLRFDRCMREEKAYLAQDLTLKSLAEIMGTSERKLSAFFGEELESNFHDAVNHFRVEEAKSVLRSGALKSHSVAGIALSCGFSSKSSFYRIFKKSTNLTPLAYVKAGDKGSHRL